MKNEAEEIETKLELLQLAKDLGNISVACKKLGFSRDSYYRFKKLYEIGGEQALRNESRNRPLAKNRVSKYIEEEIINLTFAYPGHGKNWISEQLEKREIYVSSSGIQSIWDRLDLETIPKRLKALQTKVIQDGLELTDQQQQVVEFYKQHFEFSDDMRMSYPGLMVLGFEHVLNFGSVVGERKVIIFLDHYSRYGFMKILDTEDSESVFAQFLNNNVIPFYTAQGLNLKRLAYRETKPIELPIEIDVVKICNSDWDRICSPFVAHLEERFMLHSSRKGMFGSIENAKTALQNWLSWYNLEKSEPKLYCYGKTPLKAFNDALQWTKSNK